MNAKDPTGRDEVEYLDLGALSTPTVLVLKGVVCTALDVLIEKILGDPFGWPVGTGAGFLLCAFW